MARGIQLAFTLNPRDFIKGLKRIEVDLGDVKDSLEDVADAGDDALDGLDTREAERGLERVEGAAEDLRREMDDVGDEAKDAESAFGRLGRGAKADLDKVERAARDTEDEIGDIEDEANASAKEFGSAFRGDPVEALEEVQSYLAEIVSVKLPGFAGAAATIAGGAVLGLVVAGVEQWREKQERINEIATGFKDIIQEAVDGPLSETNRAYQDLIDKQIVLSVLEEASAAQLTNLALLAAARGETTEQYVNNVLTGEVSTQDELARIQAERNAIADELLRITSDNNAANDDQIPILQAQDKALEDQGAALRSVGGFINENVAGYDKAKTAQENVGKATDSAKEKQRALNLVAAQANVGPLVRSLEDAEVRAQRVADKIDGIPREVAVKVVVTEERRDAAAASRASTGQQP